MNYACVFGFIWSWFVLFLLAHCTTALTVLAPFPEHLDLQLIVMVMRGCDLQAQVTSCGGVQGGVRVRQGGGEGEVRE